LSTGQQTPITKKLAKRFMSSKLRHRHFSRLRIGISIPCALGVVIVSSMSFAEKPFGLSKRVPFTTSRLSGTPEPPPPFQAKRIYPNLKFDQPLHVIKEPTSQKFLLTQRNGYILELSHDRSTKKPTVFLKVGRESYSLCFHPRYAENGYLYVFNNGRIDGKVQNRISRYTVSRKPPYRADPKSELVILQFRSNGHNGHFLRFGADGMLWISAGDGTVGMDPAMDGQKISNLRSTMMRIDIDHPSQGKPYGIPKDNPFVNTPHARPEIWAFGFRNPYRFTFDPKNNQLWVADIGQDAWEMIYHVEKGGNYGWSIMEGPAALNLTRPKGPGKLIPPVISHPHSEMRSITGGFFYRGKKFPELQGAFLYGDYDTRRIWAMRYDYERKKVTWQREIATTKYRVISLDEDEDREIIGTAFGGELFTLERIPPRDKPKFPFPRKLSESGLFESVKDHKLVPAAIPYSVNSPLWSDGAFKERFMTVPGLEKVTFTKHRAWGFPLGTVLVKSFSIETEKGNPASLKRIETRFLVLHDNAEWVGYSYKWNDEQTEAYLVEKAGEDATYKIADRGQPGGIAIKKWRFPSRAECMVCHTREAHYALGLTTVQLNKIHDYNGVKDNQLRALAHIGLLDKPPKGPPERLPRIPNPFDETQPLEARVRSYLHANCAHCHVTNGGGNAQMELEYNRSLEQTKIYDVKPRQMTFGVKDARLIAPGSPERSVILHRIGKRGKSQMPPVGSYEVDEKAVLLLKRWIESLPAYTKEK